jgi:hypothetical protein
MSVFSLVPYPEDIGQDIIETIYLSGYVYDILGNPLEEEVAAELNKRASRYKDQFTIDGTRRIVVSDSADGSWLIELPDNSNMPPDSYYRFEINEKIIRKVLQDYPLDQVLNQLEDY